MRRYVELASNRNPDSGSLESLRKGALLRQYSPLLKLANLPFHLRFFFKYLSELMRFMIWSFVMLVVAPL